MLTTNRLVLRAFSAADTSRFWELASDWQVARMTSDIPHPLSNEQALAWLRPAEGEARFAIDRDGELIGGIGYFRRTSGAAELGFWLGREYWGQGYATEAGIAVVRHGFIVGRHDAFTSSHFHDNPASGRVLIKLGFEPAGDGEIWSTARGQNVPAQFFWLTRARASDVLQISSREARKPGRLSALIVSTLFARGARSA